jgi:integrase
LFPLRTIPKILAFRSILSRGLLSAISQAEVEVRSKKFSGRRLTSKADEFKRKGTITPYVFHHRGGNPIAEFRRSWKTACKNAAVPGRLFHDFRRTAVRDLKIAAERLESFARSKNTAKVVQIGQKGQ